MHAAWMDHKTLVRLEGALWGNTSCSGAISIRLRTMQPESTAPFKQERYRQGHAAPNSGTHFLAYGMAGDDQDNPDKDRFYVIPGACWELIISVRQPWLSVKDAQGKVSYLPVASAELALDEARNALWLLSQYGGVGAKSRKGFGSIEVTSLTGSLKQCRLQQPSCDKLL